MVNSVNRYRGSDIPANGLSGSFFVKEEYAVRLEWQLDSVESMTLMLEEREWAEHAGKGPVAERLESAITEMHNELDAQRLRADTAEAEVARLRETATLAAKTGAPNFHSLKRELAAAEQRIAEHLKVFDTALFLLETFIEAEREMPIPTMEVLLDAIRRQFAALNPNPEAESHE